MGRKRAAVLLGARWRRGHAPGWVSSTPAPPLTPGPVPGLAAAKPGAPSGTWSGQGPVPPGAPWPAARRRGPSASACTGHLLAPAPARFVLSGHVAAPKRRQANPVGGALIIGWCLVIIWQLPALAGAGPGARWLSVDIGAEQTAPTDDIRAPSTRCGSRAGAPVDTLSGCASGNKSDGRDDGGAPRYSSAAPARGAASPELATGATGAGRRRPGAEFSRKRAIGGGACTWLRASESAETLERNQDARLATDVAPDTGAVRAGQQRADTFAGAGAGAGASAAGPAANQPTRGKRERFAAGRARRANGPGAPSSAPSGARGTPSAPTTGERVHEKQLAGGGPNLAGGQPPVLDEEEMSEQLVELLAQFYAHLQRVNDQVEAFRQQIELNSQLSAPGAGPDNETSARRLAEERDNKNKPHKYSNKSQAPPRTDDNGPQRPAGQLLAEWAGRAAAATKPKWRTNNKFSTNKQQLIEQQLARLKMQLGADEESLLKWLRQRQDKFSLLKNVSFELIHERPNRTINVCIDGPKILVLPNVSDILYCYTREQWIDKLWSDLRLSAFHYPIIILNILIFLFGTTGNIFVCLSVKRNLQLRSVTNYFIVNLAFADFLVILICLPATVVWDLSLTWFFDTIPCKLIMFLQVS